MGFKGTALFQRKDSGGPWLSPLEMERMAARIDTGATTAVYVRAYEALPEPISDEAERMGDPSEFRAVEWHGPPPLQKNEKQHGRQLSVIMRVPLTAYNKFMSMIT